MKDLLCRAFCDALEVRPVPAGFAVRTPYTTSYGDPLLVYLIREGDRFRLEDDGTQVPMLEANGVNLGGGVRRRAFQALLGEHGASFDKETRTVGTAPLAEAELGAAAVSFAALLLRLQDLALLTVPMVRNVFREDAVAAIYKAFEGRAEIEDRGALAEEIVGPGADIIVRPPEKPSLAIFIGTSELRVMQALVMKMNAEKYVGIAAHVALLIETARDNPVTNDTLNLAHLRLDRVLPFRGNEPEAIAGLLKLSELAPVTETLQ